MTKLAASEETSSEGKEKTANERNSTHTEDGNNELEKINTYCKSLLDKNWIDISGYATILRGYNSQRTTKNSKDKEKKKKDKSMVEH